MRSIPDTRGLTTAWLLSLGTAAAMACLIGADTRADVQKTMRGADPPASTRAIEAGLHHGGTPTSATDFESGFEPPCELRYVGGGGSGEEQNCDWHASASAQPGYVQPEITNTMPFEGDQHLHFEFDPNQPFGDTSRNWAFSDDITPAPEEGVSYLSLQLKISNIAGGNTVIIQPQAPTQELLTTQMHFNTDGTIGASDDNGDCADGFFQPNIITAFNWTPGEYVTVEICVDTINDRIRYYYNGQRVYSTGAGEGGIGGPLGCGVFAGSIIEHVLIRYNENANDGVTVDVDNVVIINAPGGEEECPADFNDDRVVGFQDLLQLLAAWGPYDPCPPFAAEDLDEDCDVGFQDLLELLAAWGDCAFVCPE